jgi:hypothetical protein
MWIEADGSALNTLSRKWVDALRVDARRFGQRVEFRQERQVATTTLEDLFVHYGLPYFVKVDVEGYELNVLRGMKRPVPFLSFEVNLPEFRAEGLECIDVLHRLAADGSFNFSVDCRRGFQLADWVGARDFANLLERCEEGSIEVFWRTHPIGDRSLRTA